MLTFLYGNVFLRGGIRACVKHKLSKNHFFKANIRQASKKVLQNEIANQRAATTHFTLPPWQYSSPQKPKCHFSKAIAPLSTHENATFGAQNKGFYHCE